MALNKTQLKTDIDTLLNALLAYDGSLGQTQADAIEKFKTDLADAIDTFVKSGTIPSGIAVSVDPNTGVGSTTGTGTIS